MGQSGAWAKSRIVRVWIVLAVLAGAGTTFAATGGPPSVIRPIRIVLPALRGANGTVTDAQCRAIPDGTTFVQVLRTYGWPQRVTDSQRNTYSSQETDGLEMDYPVRASLHAKFVRFCAVVFGSRRGSVDHKWEDLP